MITVADLHDLRADWLEAGRPSNSRYRRAVERSSEQVRSAHLIALPLLHDNPAMLRSEAERERTGT